MGFQFQRHFAFITALLLLALNWNCRGTEDARYFMPRSSFNQPLSSNWVAAVRAALPGKLPAKGNLNFQEATNLLCQATRQGNNAAKGLWGIVLVSQSPSPETAEAGLQLMRDSAAKGDVQVILQLGFLYKNGLDVRRNYNEAFHWFGLAADQSNAVGQLELGACYQYGLGTSPDLATAAKWYRRAAEQTNYVAMKSLGYLLMNGYGVNKDLKAAKYWLTRAAEEGGIARAMYNLGVLYGLKFPATNAMAKAFQWFQRSAKLNDPLACLELADFYYRGWGVVKTNMANYDYWRLKAALLGSTQAQYEMGQAYQTGNGVPIDLITARVWYLRAAAKHHPAACYDLALLDLEDKTNPASLKMAHRFMLLAAKGGHREAELQCALTCFRDQDFEGGREWLNKAAKTGWNRAEFYLFELYYSGAPPAPGCPAYPKDRAKAIKWLRSAAHNGNLHAQAALADMLIQGVGMKQNKNEAVKLLRNAAEHGYASAQNDLGYAFETGDAGKVDWTEAAIWCKLAVENATDPRVLHHAQFNLDQALAQLSEDQQREVRHQVQKFKALPTPQPNPLVPGWSKNPSYEQEDGEYFH